MGFFFSKIVRNIVLLYILYSGVQYLLRWKSYSFSPKEFRTLAAKAQDSAPANGASAANRFAHDLIRSHGGKVVPDPKWVPISSSGLHIKVELLHVSLTEYVAVFNAPFATQGRSGFHWSNSTCTVLSGSVERAEDHSSNVANNKESFKTGGNFRHGQFESYIYKFGDDTFVVCYGRGFIPASLGWPLLGSLSSGDLGLLFRQAMSFGEAYFFNAIHSIQTTVDYYKQKALKTEL